jgi:hypothetical protein
MTPVGSRDPGFQEAPAGGTEVIVADRHADSAGGDRSLACAQREVRRHVEDEVVAARVPARPYGAAVDTWTRGPVLEVERRPLHTGSALLPLD